MLSRPPNRLAALALLAVVTGMTLSLPVMAVPTASKATTTPLKLSPTSDVPAIDTSKLATKADLTKLSNAIIQVYGKVAELERRQSQGAGGGDAGQVGQQIQQLAQQTNQLQAQLQALQASQNQLRESITAILDRMHRLDGATVSNP